jgi:hypothetical protein
LSVVQNLYHSSCESKEVSYEAICPVLSSYFADGEVKQIFHNLHAFSLSGSILIIIGIMPYIFHGFLQISLTNTVIME